MIYTTSVFVKPLYDFLYVKLSAIVVTFLFKISQGHYLHS